MDRCDSSRGRKSLTMMVAALGLLVAQAVHAELLIDKTPASADDEASVRSDTNAGGASSPSGDTGSGDDEVLFTKPVAPVIPHRTKELQCAPLKNPKGWDRALGWRNPDQPLPTWGWTRDRWCGDLDHVLDRVSVPVNQLGRWAACEGAQANGRAPSRTMAAACAARYDPKDWVDMRPRMTVYSVGTWTVQGQACPAVVLQLDQLAGPLGGSQTHVLVPLEGHCPDWHGFNPLSRNWTPGPVTPALVAEGQQRWAGYDGDVPDGWAVAFVPMGQAASVSAAPSTWPVTPDPATPPVLVQGLALPPPVTPDASTPLPNPSWPNPVSTPSSR